MRKIFLLARWFKDELGEVIKSLFPVLEIVRVFIHMPDVRDVFFLRVGVNTLADTDQPIFIAARKP